MSSQITPRRPQQPQTLIDFAQEHERAWGNEQYLNRPTLADILNAPVVVFWKPNIPADDNPRQKNPTPIRETITLHQSLSDVEQFITRMVFRTGVQPLDKQLVRIFRGGKRVKIKGVRIIFEDDTPTDDEF
ncbi:MAG: hypothetical protein CUN52_13405 [Phototrophicales bacterium]|nr:MAG: hypothetical protein CUN52_13405 [Phototrophicales bacterium]